MKKLLLLPLFVLTLLAASFPPVANETKIASPAVSRYFTLSTNCAPVRSTQKFDPDGNVFGTEVCVIQTNFFLRVIAEGKDRSFPLPEETARSTEFSRPFTRNLKVRQ